MSALLKFLKGSQHGLRTFLELLPQLRDFWQILARIFASVCRWIHKRRPHRRGGCCVDIPMSEYKRPDPLLYSQTFLMQQGLAVTWDNPDIQLYDKGVPVSSYNLLADHDYDVVVRVWNNSYAAPAANLPVYLSYLDFGVGTTPIHVGKDYIDLGVKGSSQCPAFSKFTWHTPKTSGHYCLRALLDWPDDENPDNNLGQENANVGLMQSPAKFKFTINNAASVDRRYQLEADMYRLPPRSPCPPEMLPARGAVPRTTRLKESRQRWAKALATQGYGKFPVTSEWKVTIDPSSFSLAANQEIVVNVAIEHIPDTFEGQQAFNINAFASSPHQDRAFVGGVTLLVQGEN